VMPNQKIRLKVRLYKYPKTSTARLLDLKDGGSSVLSKFIGAYKTETKDFTGPGLTEPVVILYDNDDGAKGVRKTIKSVSNLMPTGTEPFVHVFKNLYAVPTPFGVNETPTKIEDFFDDSTKAAVVDGKTFNLGDGFNKDKHYSKKVFAHKVVRPKADTIDFSSFRPLLTNLSAAIIKHKTSVVP
jgi:RNA-directed DNA polymerase